MALIIPQLSFGAISETPRLKIQITIIQSLSVRGIPRRSWWMRWVDLALLKRLLSWTPASLFVTVQKESKWMYSVCACVSVPTSMHATVLKFCHKFPLIENPGLQWILWSGLCGANETSRGKTDKKKKVFRLLLMWATLREVICGKLQVERIWLNDNRRQDTAMFNGM